MTRFLNRLVYGAHYAAGFVYGFMIGLFTPDPKKS